MREIVQKIHEKMKSHSSGSPRKEIVFNVAQMVPMFMALVDLYKEHRAEEQKHPKTEAEKDHDMHKWVEFGLVGLVAVLLVNHFKEHDERLKEEREKRAEDEAAEKRERGTLRMRQGEAKKEMGESLDRLMEEYREL